MFFPGFLGLCCGKKRRMMSVTMYVCAGAELFGFIC